MSQRIYHLTINEREYKIEVESFTADEAVLKCNDKEYSIRLDQIERIGSPMPAKPAAPSAAPAAAAPAPAAAPAAGGGGGGGSVTAPIPGSILSLAVGEGDTVTAGQTVLKMEAMKMENEISANKAGKVTKIHVKVGDSVGQGAPLIDIE